MMDFIIEEAIKIVLTAALIYAVPALAVLIVKFVKTTIDKQQNAMIKWAAWTAVRYAEQVIPDRGQGEAKFALAAAYLASRYPFLKSNELQLKAIIEEAVWEMDDQLDALLPTAGGTG